MSFPARLVRITRMSPAELASRAGSAARVRADRCRTRIANLRWRREHLAPNLAHQMRDAVGTALRRGDWPAAHAALLDHLRRRPSRFLLTPAHRVRTATHVTSRHPQAADDAAALADRLLAGHYDLLGYEGLQFRDASGGIDWHLDPVSGRRAPRSFWADVDYLDPRHGDHKVIWELNRHQHWLALGRAWWLTDDPRYRQAFVSELQSWLRGNPPLIGVNWASALELAFRSLSWIWALHFFASDPDGADDAWAVDLLVGLVAQVRHVERNLSWYFSPNTHLLGEGLALYVCGRVLPELAPSARWTALGRRVLVGGLARQVLADGAHVERSPHYHRYALDFYLLALAVARLTDDEVTADALAPAADRMAGWLYRMADTRGRLPLIGDDDGGELFPIDGLHGADARVSLGWAADLLSRPDLRIDPVPEAVTWLTLDPRSRRARGSVETALRETQVPLASATGEASGYVVIRRGTSHLVFDGGPHGFLNGGHAHADALAVTLGAAGEPLLVDPGTATYTMDAGLRDRFRSSHMHNTLVLDGRSQSTPRGPFHWATTAGGRLDRIVLGRSFDYLRGDTDAWAPTRHQRHVLAIGDDTWLIADEVLGTGVHEAAVHWHLSPAWIPRQQGNTIHLAHGAGARAQLTVPDARVEVFSADAQTGLGWMAPVYGRVVPTHAIRATTTAPLPCWLATIVTGDPPGTAHALTRLEVQATESSGASLALLHARGGALEASLIRGAAAQGVATIALDAERVVRTDARVLHVGLDAARRLTRICAIDATLVALEGPTPFRLAAPRLLEDVVVRSAPGSAPVIESSGAIDDITLDIDTRRSLGPAFAARPPRHRGSPSATPS